MKISVIKKPLGRVRALQAVDYELPQRPETLRQLLQQIVMLEVERYNEVDTLTAFLLEDVQGGSIKFGPITERKQAVLEESLAVMALAFEDGLFKVVQGEHVYTTLDEAIISDEPQWTFIKLAFLTGR